MDLWSADRQTVADFWSQPENLGPAVNSTSADSFPSLSSDGQTLFFNSDRLDPDSSGELDLYVISRSKAK